MSGIINFAVVLDWYSPRGIKMAEVEFIIEKIKRMPEESPPMRAQICSPPRSEYVRDLQTSRKGMISMYTGERGICGILPLQLN